MGLFFHGLLVGFFLEGGIVDFGEGWEFFADHVADFGADLVRAAGSGAFSQGSVLVWRIGRQAVRVFRRGGGRRGGPACIRDSAGPSPLASLPTR